MANDPDHKLGLDLFDKPTKADLKMALTLRAALDCLDSMENIIDKFYDFAGSLQDN